MKRGSSRSSENSREAPAVGWGMAAWMQVSVLGVVRKGADSGGTGGKAEVTYCWPGREG